MMTLRLRAVPLATLALALVACGPKASPPDADSMAAANAPPPVAPAPVTVRNIDIGRSLNADKGINDNTDSFGLRDTFYVSVHTDGTGNATLGAHWATEAGKLVDSASQEISANGDARTEFHVMKKSAWAPGKYQVDITLNGVAAGSKTFEVKTP